MKLVLASGSPRRAELLRVAGFEPLIRPADVDESLREGENPESYLRRLAGAKARGVPLAPDEVVLAADTAVIRDGAVLGKPRDASDAASMLTSLSGRAHEVRTGVAVRTRANCSVAVVRTTVVVDDLEPEDIAAYVSSGDPLDKAGAYGIQGPFGRHVRSITGSWTNVVGLPLEHVLPLLAARGICRR